MKKLKLNELKVESFETGFPKKENGTVKGQCDINSTKPHTEARTCRDCHTDDDTCGGTCYNTCFCPQETTLCIQPMTIGYSCECPQTK